MKSYTVFLLHAVINCLDRIFSVIKRNKSEAGHILPVFHCRKRSWNRGFSICIFIHLNLRGLGTIFLYLLFLFLPRLKSIIFKAFNAFQGLSFYSLHPLQFELTKHLHLHAVFSEFIGIFLLFEITKSLHRVLKFARFLELLFRIIIFVVLYLTIIIAFLEISLKYGFF